MSLYFWAPFLLSFSFLSYKSATNFILSSGSQHPSRFNLENIYFAAMLSLVRGWMKAIFIISDVRL